MTTSRGYLMGASVPAFSYDIATTKLCLLSYHRSLLDLTSMSDDLWVFFRNKRDGVWSAIRHVLTTTTKQGFLPFLNNVIFLWVFLAIMATLAYAAKAVTYLRGLYVSTRVRLPLCPSFIKREYRGEIDGPDDIRGDTMQRLPTLFKRLSAEPKDIIRAASSRDVSPVTSPTLESCDEGAELLTLRSMRGVVQAAQSRKERDRCVADAAKKFLLAARHDKLYPPSNIYHIHIDPRMKFAEEGDAASLVQTIDPFEYSSLEKSSPEYFGWLLFSGILPG